MSAKNEGLIFISGGLGALVALGIVLWQIYIFLKSGQWLSLSVISALNWCQVEWAIVPTEWFGLYKVLNWLPLSLTSLIIGSMPFYWSSLSGNI